MSSGRTLREDAIDNARALLDALLAGNWQEIHVVSGGTEIFIARAGGSANPMREQRAELASVAIAPPATRITAPHIGTVVEVSAPGTQLLTGEPIAKLQVLDTRHDVPVPLDGIVTMVDVSVSDLVEFGARIGAVAPVQRAV